MKTTLIALASLAAISGTALSYDRGSSLGYGSQDQTYTTHGITVRNIKAFDPFALSAHQAR